MKRYRIQFRTRTEVFWLFYYFKCSVLCENSSYNVNSSILETADIMQLMPNRNIVKRYPQVLMC